MYILKYVILNATLVRILTVERESATIANIFTVYVLADIEIRDRWPRHITQSATLLVLIAVSPEAYSVCTKSNSEDRITA